MPLQTTLTNKLKVQLKMAIQRLRMLQQKSTAIAKQQRRAMAELLGEAKLESARIRVENIIRSDISTELHEILELYCELLLARIQLLEGPVVVPGLPRKEEESKPEAVELDPGLDEAVRSIMYAAPRTEIKELSQARMLLVEKFGKEYAARAAEGTGVPERVVKRVRVETPSRELVDAYLKAIGSTYGVRFPGDSETDDEDDGGLGEAEELQEGEGGDGDGGGGGGGNKIRALEAPLEAEDLTKATPPRDLGDSRSPFRIAPPSPSTENPGPRIKMPGGSAPKPRKPSIGTGAGSKAAAGAPKSISTALPKGKEKGDGPGGNIPNVDELAKRFAALKRG